MNDAVCDSSSPALTGDQPAHTEERVAASKRATNPRLNPAIAVELSMRERDALMDTDDWSLLVDLALAQEAAR